MGHAFWFWCVTVRLNLQHAPHEGKVQICNTTSSPSPHRGASATPATHVCSACGHGLVATAEGSRAVGAATCARHGPPAAARLATLLNTRARDLRCPPDPPRGPGHSPRGEFL